MKHVSFSGRLVMVGFGSIDQGVLPLILRHIDMPADRIVIVTAEDRGHDVANEYGIRVVTQPPTRANYQTVIETQPGAGDFPPNLSVDVSSIPLVKLVPVRAYAQQN